MTHPAPQLLRLPPPTDPYVLRITVDAGTAASRNGVLRTNFPLEGGAFERETFASVRCVCSGLLPLLELGRETP